MCTRQKNKVDQCRPATRHQDAKLKNFVRDEDGSLLIFGVYVFVLILMVAGIGIDLMRAERDRARLQNTLDNAVLAAADLDQQLDAAAVVNDYFEKAQLSQHLGNVSVSQGISSKSVSAAASAEMQTQFMHMTGLDTIRMPAASTAVEYVKNVEISLVLDISGSMRWEGRMDALRPAAKDFVTSVLSDGLDKTTSINLIPYAGQTNPGPEMFDILGGQRFGETDDDYFPEWGQDISNITIWFDVNNDGVIDPDVDYSAKIEGYPDNDVDAFNKDDLDEYYQYAVDYIVRQEPNLDSGTAAVGATIKGGKLPTTFFNVETGSEIEAPTDFNQPDLELQFNNFYADVVPNDLASCIEMTAADFETSGLPTGSQEQVAHFMTWGIAADVMDWGWCPQDDTAIQYAQNSESRLHTFIDGIRMHDGTGTFYGMKYALALLDPTTQPAFAQLASYGLVPNEFSTRPFAFEATETAKFVVLMTDGQITDQYRPVDKLHPDNLTTELDYRPWEDRETTSVRADNLDRFYAQCDLAKANGVTIYTIAFAAPSGAETEMRNCASSPSHFHIAGTGDIGDVFEAIASSIKEQKLRLTQ